MRQEEAGQQQQHVVDEAAAPPDDHPISSGNDNSKSHSDIVDGEEAHVDVNDIVNDNDIHDHDHNKLLLWQGVALLTADCMGVGVLALPNDIQVLGFVVGIGFLVANLPINYYAGNLLAVLALDIEEEQHGGMVGGPNNVHDRRVIEQIPTHDEEEGHEDEEEENGGNKRRDYRRRFRRKGKNGDVETTEESTGIQMTETSFTDPSQSLGGNGDIVGDNSMSSSPTTLNRRTTSSSTSNHGNLEDTNTSEVENGDRNKEPDGLFRQDGTNKNSLSSTLKQNDDHTSKNSNENNFHEDYYFDDTDGDNATTDLINISRTVFSPQAVATYMVKIFYYTNLFLVLGDYILVMARSVSAVFADEICLPTAGLIASVLMFGLCQFRSMASLGRTVSLASLLALLIVIIQCLFHHRTSSSSSSSVTSGDDNDTQVQDGDFEDEGIFGKMSSLAGIGFAVGSQKLFLNIRHELRHREESSKVLAGSLTCYGFAYVTVIILAGPDPPSFLFDAIPEGWSRRIAGLLLWFHVAVSYAINSQALCGSLDRFISSSTSKTRRPGVISAIKPVHRWLALTLIVTISSYLVANAIPFFKDLVGLIGALTSVPLSLTLPALLHRKAHGVYMLLPGRNCDLSGSYILFLFSLLFLAIGLIGSVSSIDEDWMNKGKPFSCR